MTVLTAAVIITSVLVIAVLLAIDVAIHIAETKEEKRITRITLNHFGDRLHKIEQQIERYNAPENAAPSCEEMADAFHQLGSHCHRLAQQFETGDKAAPF